MSSLELMGGKLQLYRRLNSRFCARTRPGICNTVTSVSWKMTPPANASLKSKCVANVASATARARRALSQRVAHVTGALKTDDMARITMDTTVQPKNIGEARRCCAFGT